ncbi:MAG TPA: glutathione S-transferase [Caulobacteraceae bacterium]|nr:glutathione S-transferase [Caulobacteraceae bacterium]
MQLYDSRRAPNPRRVRWLMAEKQITDIEVIDVDLFGGQHKRADYLERAGLPNVPALTMDDGTTITESVAICRYLESLYPEPNLFGRDPKETAIIEMWLRRAEMMLATPLMLAVRHGHPALAALETQIPEVAASNRATGERALKLFDRRLAESRWIGAERISIVDGVAFIGMDFARMVKFAVPPELTHLTRWLGAMRERVSASAGV